MSKTIDVLNTIWASYTIPDDVELPDLKNISDEDLMDFVYENHRGCNYLFDTAEDIPNNERGTLLYITSFPTLEIRDENYNIIYDNGASKSKT